MGLLDGLLSNVTGAAPGGTPNAQTANPLDSVLSGLTAGNHAQSSSLLNAALSMVQQSGGLERLLGALRQNGLGAQADSWVGTGPNTGISAQQLEQAVGGNTVSNLASQLGMTNGQAGSALAKLLPEIVNQLTPNGTLPANHHDLISEGLAALRAKGL